MGELNATLETNTNYNYIGSQKSVSDGGRHVWKNRITTDRSIDVFVFDGDARDNPGFHMEVKGYYHADGYDHCEGYDGTIAVEFDNGDGPLSGGNYETETQAIQAAKEYMQQNPLGPFT